MGPPERCQQPITDASAFSVDSYFTPHPPAKSYPQTAPATPAESPHAPHPAISDPPQSPETHPAGSAATASDRTANPQNENPCSPTAPSRSTDPSPAAS